MPRLSFITPAALTLLGLLPLLWWLAFLAPRRLARWRFWTALLLRTVALAALVLALAGAQIVTPVRDLAVVFLVDSSDSIAPTQREQATEYINSALRGMPQGSQAAVVVFGANAVVERAPAALAALSRISALPIPTRTNIQDAIQLSMALLPADTQKRLVLLSDGGENDGRAVEAARLAAARGIPIDVVDLPSAQGPDVLLAALETPSSVREGQEIGLGAVVRSSLATTAQLQAFADGQLVAELRDLAISPGTQTIPLRIPAGLAGFRRLEVRLDAEGDSAPQNNRAVAFSEVIGPPRILLIASEPARAENLRQALEAASVRPVVLPPAQVPADLVLLRDYAGIVLVDTPAREMPSALLDTLPVYVRDLGRGLAMVGGEESFGAGGYRRTPLEQVLPVHLDPNSTSTTPDVALAMVIDRSGSMGDESGGSGRSKLDLAKEAVYQASLGLAQRDQLGLVVFDTEATWVLPLQKLPPAVELEQALSRFNDGGGTNIRPGIEEAARALEQAEARVKHVILLTDGEADSNYSDLIDQMRAGGVTISTVAIGADSNPNLRTIAESGGGRYYRVARGADVPQIFLQETITVAGRDIVRGQFEPAIGLPAPIVRGLTDLPALYGYNGTELKEAARAILLTPEGKPVLAQWQYGLGRAVAWTSDLKNLWGKDWITWGQFPRFVGGLVDLLLPPPVTERLSLQSITSGAETALDLLAQDAEGRPLNDLAVDARMVDPAGQSVTLSFSQIGPGRYRATARTEMAGVYLAEVAANGEQGPVGTVSTGVAVSYSPEYGDQRANPQLLRDLADLTGGRAAPPASAVFAPTDQPVGSTQEAALALLWLALLLWPLDIAVRRLFLAPGELVPSRRPAAVPAAPPDPTLARLGTAKRRALGERASPRTAEQRTPKPAEQAPPQQAPSAAATPPASGTLDDDQFGRLLAAKRRARTKRDE
ncbi:MAG TPA: VWA domain-containing protein [Roseiflexaceae bacterium]|nr:VWA domain-containing protein [Roseiflexaceae bacterium]